MRMPVAQLGLLVLAAMSPCVSVQGQCYGERQELTAPVPHDDNLFGWAISRSGDWAVVGAKHSDALGDRSGEAYLLRREAIGRWDQGRTWRHAQSLTASDGGENHWFGSQVAIDGDIVAVSAPLNNGGAVYIFRRHGGTWVEEAVLTDPTPHPWNAFGYSLALEGDVLLVGQPLQDGVDPEDPICNSGSLSVFRNVGSNWVFEAELIPHDPQCGAQFAWICDLDAGTIVVGATGVQSGSGAVYVFGFDGTNWIEEQKLVASDGSQGDVFGHAVNLDGDRLAIGAQRDDHGSDTDAGSVYIFERSLGTWTEAAKLVSADTAAGDQFGFSVALEDDELLVGAIRHDASEVDAGAVHHFSLVSGVWQENPVLLHPNASPSDFFGVRAHLSGGTALLTASHRDLANTDQGSLHDWVIDPVASSELYGSPTSINGGVVRIEASTDPIAGTTAEVTVRHPRPLLWSRGYLYIGTESQDGTLLVGGTRSLIRFTPDSSGVTRVPVTIPSNIALCGEDVYLQAYVLTYTTDYRRYRWGRWSYWRRYRSWVGGWSEGLQWWVGN